MILLEIGNLGPAIAAIFFVLFGVPLLLLIVGIVLMANKKKRVGKILVIISLVYGLVGLGTCMGGF